MAERTSGWRRVLSAPAIYRFAQNAIGSPNVRATLVEEYLQPRDGDRVLDIGCGPGDILEYLPAVEYLGYDPSADYVAAAIESFGDRGDFLVGGVGEVSVDGHSYDLVVAKGVLHHLDDGLARRLFDDALQALKPGGRLVTIDPAFDDGQNRIARFLASRDRGQNVRNLDGYLSLVPSGFDSVDTALRHDLLRVPYSHAVIVATR
jgi:SAM-dependent methyltransferase